MKRYLLSLLLFCGLLIPPSAVAVETFFCQADTACTLDLTFYLDANPEDIDVAITFVDADILWICDAGTESATVIQAADMTDEGSSFSVVIASGDLTDVKRCKLTFIDAATKDYMDKTVNIITYGDAGAGLPGIPTATWTAADIAAILVDTGTTLDDFLDTEIAAILADTGTDGVVLANDAITAAKIATDAIGASELATDAIGAAEIATDAITAAEIAADAIGASELATAAIGNAEWDVSENVNANLEQISASNVVETTSGRMVANWNTFFDNSDGVTTKIIDNVGGGATGVRVVTGVAPTATHTTTVLELADGEVTHNNNFKWASITITNGNCANQTRTIVSSVATPTDTVTVAPAFEENGTCSTINDNFDGATYEIAFTAPSTVPAAGADLAGGLVVSDAGGLDADGMRSDVAAILVDTNTGVALANDVITAAVIAADAIGASEIATAAIGTAE